MSRIATSKPLAGVDALNSNRMSVHCCDRMDYDLSQSCEVHDTRFNCPDALIGVVRGGYGLIVHDGGSSMIAISFCPWCRARLPKTLEIALSDQEHPEQVTQNRTRRKSFSENRHFRATSLGVRSTVPPVD